MSEMIFELSSVHLDKTQKICITHLTGMQRSVNKHRLDPDSLSLHSSSVEY